jgi:hypothetical protein
VIATLFLSIVASIGWALWISHTHSNEGSVGAVGYYVTSPWIGIPLLMVIVLIFSMGFFWEFRRAGWSQRSR